jgi:signal transduction histidine kinase
MLTSEILLKRQNFHLLELSKFIGGEGEWNYPEAAKLIIDATINGLNVDRASIWSLNHTIDAMECVALFTHGAFTSDMDGFILYDHDYPRYFDALRNERFIVADDAHTHPDTSEFSVGYLTPLNIFSMLDAPIRKDGKIVGILCCEQMIAPRKWSMIEQSFAGMLADSAGRALTESERKTALKELRSVNEHLEQLVHDRTKVLEQTLESLRMTQAQLIENEKMASLGNLVAGVAHEINTPIGISVTATSHLHDTLIPLSKAFNEKTLTMNMLHNALKTFGEIDTILSNNLNRAALLIQSFKKVAVNQSDEELIEFNLYEMLNDVFNSVNHTLKTQHVALKIECDETLMVYSYAGVLSQITTNLIMNALIHAFYETHLNPTITIQASLHHDNVILKYRDNGIGMDKLTAEKVFEPFFTTKRGNGGSGLGLHIVYNLTNQKLKGEIQVESILGEGSTLTLTFPQKISH